MHRVSTIVIFWIYRIVLCAAALLLIHPSPAHAQASDAAIQTAIESLSPERMLADIRTLSAPSFNGRQAGTADDLRSAQWVAQEFAGAGLQLPLINNGSPLGAMASLVPTATIQPHPILRIGSQAGAAPIKPATRPPIILYGVVMVGSYESATIINPGRPLHKGEREAKTLKVGDRVGEYKLAKILPDRIVIQGGEDSFEVPPL